MMARFSAGGVTWSQHWLAMSLVAATAVLIVRAVSGMFRAQALLSGQAFKLKIFLRALARKMKTSKWIGVGDCQRIVKKFPKL
jgi:hypothetical protein